MAQSESLNSSQEDDANKQSTSWANAPSPETHSQTDHDEQSSSSRVPDTPEEDYNSPFEFDKRSTGDVENVNPPEPSTRKIPVENKFFKSRNKKSDDESNNSASSSKDFAYMVDPYNQSPTAEDLSLQRPVSNKRKTLGTPNRLSLSKAWIGSNPFGKGNSPIPEKDRLSRLSNSPIASSRFYKEHNSMMSQNSSTPKYGPLTYQNTSKKLLVESLEKERKPNILKPRTPLSPRSSIFNKNLHFPNSKSPTKRNLTFDKENSFEKMPEKKSRVYDLEGEDKEEYDGPIEILSPCDIGFRNFGNTCFMNATLQSLLGLRPFCRDVEAEASIMSPLLPPLQTLIKARQACNFDLTQASLKSLRHIFGRQVDTSFQGDKQHDASEFLNKLIGKLSDDIMISRKKYFSSSRHIEVKSTIVEDNFQATVADKSVCDKCKSENAHTDQVLLWFLPVPPEDVKTDDFEETSPSKDFLRSSTSKSPYSIQSLMSDYFSSRTEKCEKCEEGSSFVATKMTSMPRMIVIQLKRYNNAGDKITTPIQISSFLDLNDCVTNDCLEPKSLKPSGKVSSESPKINGHVDSDDEEMQRATELSMREKEQEEEENAQINEALRESLQSTDSDNWQPEDLAVYLSLPRHLKNCYKLMSIVSHRGYSSDSGHYLAYVYQNEAKSWFKYDDQFVTKVESQIFNMRNQQNCYMLVYMHRDIFDELEK